MIKKFDIITALDVCVDFLVSGKYVVPEFGQKEKLVEDYNIEMGGSCCIFACQAARLKLRTAGIGVVGKDAFGQLVIEKLSEAGVALDGIKLDGNIKTGMGIALCAGRDRAILTYLGTIDAVSMEQFPSELIAGARHIHIGSYYLMKRLQPYYLSILRTAKEHGLTVSLDTNWDPEENWDSGIMDIMPYVDIFLPNENEARAITGKDTLDEAIEILGKTVPVIVVKMGKDGAVAYCQGRTYSAPPVDVEVVDTVGAGDSFDAGFVYGYLSGYEIDQCLRIGCICGSMNTTRPGGIAGQVGLKEMLAMLK